VTGASDEPVTAIDIGGTKIAMARVADGVILDRRQVATPRTGKGEDLVAAIVGELGPVSPCGRIAVATTGLVRAGRLTALNPSTLPIENDFPLAAAIASATGVEPLVVNDAQAAAWGEFRHGAGRACRTFAFVTISTGIGAGLVAEGKLLVGRAGLAGHLGHVVVERTGPSCGCGRRGCLEALASGTAIARRGSDLLGRPVSAPEVFAAAEAGHDAATTLLDDAAGHLATAFADLAATCDVDRIAIGGGVGLARGFVERMRRATEDLPAAFQRPLVVAATGADAGLLGAAALME
jgi:N-acylmannosamine kinase